MAESLGTALETLPLEKYLGSRSITAIDAKVSHESFSR